MSDEDNKSTNIDFGGVGGNAHVGDKVEGDKLTHTGSGDINKGGQPETTWDDVIAAVGDSQYGKEALDELKTELAQPEPDESFIKQSIGLVKEHAPAAIKTLVSLAAIGGVPGASILKTVLDEL